MTYLSHTNVPDALVYSTLGTGFGMTVVLFITGGVGLKNKRRRTVYDDELHGKASAYANNRRDAYIAQMQLGKVKKRSQDELNWIWVAHYKGYKEGYWTATSNNFFTTDPAKLRSKNNG